MTPALPTSLNSYSVPDLNFYGEVINDGVLRTELYSKGGLMVPLESIFCKSKQEAGFANT